ncbi:60S RIBOSOMAL PROTEIN L13 [Encephalitozoon cuniculi GB-M1]|uniref:60S RIBOSOMAL PROTEIN L13 n=2 Tax=Encephalitozoon cuniculi TaxID=6035 RepID=Q8SSC1_ENCCU|nr:60S ribosomal protein L13 [Encephalitozoon cuniculi GB-M1]7QEP_M3 Chain M3, 60S RIBOSOMAL PROTEIN L13 [Encephalitozoon cuniculi GB-M1]AGE95980.1 60S ribosomal protein l13 [Encephalitozoon cuniculi]KMV66396.1 60S ribosomal protein L13 [Encephalitozoon cuniculi EcunIII-L]UYI28022.1 ribosomal protein L13A [Encephalitozoon cuniculi]CAD26179.1 60S RIBOSOMAL PROTEIN L13 [Encephalitozoon cuniculi GB-M1]
MKGNHALPNNHFRKTSLKIRIHHDPETKARVMAEKKLRKAKALFPMPLKKLRPIVRCPTIKYNRNERLGRGFTAAECEKAGLDYRHARRLGIAVDLRRRDTNQEAFDKNVERIKTYLGKITIYESVKEARESGAKPYTKEIMPFVKPKPVVGSISREEVASYE